MRYLGSDPRKPADELERLVMWMLNNRVVAEHKKAAEKNG